LARLLRRHWHTNLSLGSGLSRRDRMSCGYDAYEADPLMDRGFTFAGSVAADVAEAERKIVGLNARSRALVDTEALARLLLRAESVASSRIEGLEINARRLLKADAARQVGEQSTDVTAVEVLANIDAMSYAAQAVGQSDRITVKKLLDIHRRLLSGTRLESQGGRARRVQNWIGGSSFNPCSAAFVPPPPENVEPLLEDLCSFCNQDNLPAVAQAAIAHAQFETIHPFVDGNGRVGRTLIHIVLRRRGLAPRVLPPVSLVLATWAKDYVAGLMATRYVGSPSSNAARDGIELWVGRFAAACKRAVADADEFEHRVESLQVVWRERLGRIRSRSALALLLEKLPGAPVLTVQGAASLIERSFQATNEAINRLVESQILSEATTRLRNRVFEARDVVRAFTDLERRLASPTGNTRTAPPTRRVPYRNADQERLA
jgi:Fic family protein